MGSSTQAAAEAGGQAGSAEVKPLSDVAIVRAARDIISESWVEGLTMRRLSNRLGVALGATYHHVPTKRALMKLVIEDLYREIEFPDTVGGDWAEQVKTMMVSTARVVSAYPGLAAYTVTEVDDLSREDLNKSVVEVLREAGFSARSIGVVLGALYFYGAGISANLLPLRGSKAFEGIQVDALFEEGLDMVLAGARVWLEADVERRRARQAR